MHKVDIYLLKNSIYILLLANLIALILHKLHLFLHLNVIALGLDLIVFFLIRLTIYRYAGKFDKTRPQIKDLLGRYIEDDAEDKLSFHDYIKKHIAEVPPRHT